MAWKNGYYYRQKRQGETCISEYVGNGPGAQLVAIQDEQERTQRRLEQQKLQGEIEKQRIADSQIDDIVSQVRELVHTVLTATGHYNHHGEWRKAKMKELTIKHREDAVAVLNRIQSGKGTSDDEKRFKNVLKQVPEMARLWGDLPANAIRATIKEMTSTFALRSSLETRVEQLKAEYGYSDASPLEQMLIEQILLCWLRLYQVEILIALNAEILTNNPKRMEHMDKRLNNSQRRFLRAIETLARVRRLARLTPEILQVNIGQQQVNAITQ